MSTVQIPAVAPRRTGEPEPDLTSMYVIHRAMLGDLRRLTALLSGPVVIRGERLTAMRRYTASLLLEIHHHHVNEDELLWPLIERTAGQAVDLSPFTDDHETLAPLLEACRRALRGARPVAGEHARTTGGAHRGGGE
ncbi:hemerythrin domain-containing protein [Nonomuraea sp. NPDC050536]|uniref:hemerythrin domain-containing protein n=1 Tax=Nonomuraea sp. NPDC050536 TaxID=3364366 RepID=UPI0037CC500A